MLFGRRGSLRVSKDALNRWRLLTDHLARNIGTDELEESRVVDPTARERGRVSSVLEAWRHGLKVRSSAREVGHGEGRHGECRVVVVGGGSVSGGVEIVRGGCDGG